MGRFAPSPTGDLHLGSMYAAAASYLDARAHGGRWLVRIEDLDAPRERPGAALRMLRTLESYGFEWDGPIVRQRSRVEAHRAALEHLRARGLTFECTCSRRGLAEESRYPGRCRVGPGRPGTPSATRLRVDPEIIEVADRIQGHHRQSVADAIGDFVIWRRDGVAAYQLAVVVDDAASGVTDVVRGADLLEATPRQILLQRHLGLPTPRYAHVPVLTEADGSKLSKSARSVPVDGSAPLETLGRVFERLGLPVVGEFAPASVAEAWSWGISHWRTDRVPPRPALAAEPPMGVR